MGNDKSLDVFLDLVGAEFRWWKLNESDEGLCITRYWFMVFGVYLQFILVV